MFGNDLFGEPVVNAHKSVLAQTFEYPPFSVLNAREGWWQERKRQWLALGIKSEVGRGDNALGMSLQTRITNLIGGHYEQAAAFVTECRASGIEGDEDIIEAAREKWNLDRGRPAREYARTFGQDLMRKEHVVGSAEVPDPGPLPEEAAASRAKPRLAPGGGGTGCWIGGKDRPTGSDAALKEDRPGSPEGLVFGAVPHYDGHPRGEPSATGTSIFDPVLTELCYRWFCPPDGHILDPFAGGSVRGIVASVLGYDYTGFELRGEQVYANRDQAAAICPERPPRWIIGDSAENLPAWGGGADFVFSCPPYGDLEVYSELEADISNMPHDEFLSAYRTIIGAAANNLKPDRFAAFVIGDFRDKRGFYRNFPAETIAAFQAAGLHYYNECILVTAVGSLPVRTGKQFRASRKLGKTHQNIVVFVKGDPKKAAAACNGEGA